MASAHANRLHEKGRRRLRRLARANHYQCYWCGCTVMVAREAARRFPKSWVSGGHVHYRDRNDNYGKAPMATVDHLLPISEGGTNAEENLRLACYVCNNERNRAEPDLTCRECGARIKKGRQHCPECKMKRAIRYLVEQGWDVWPDGPAVLLQHPHTKRLLGVMDAIKSQAQINIAERCAAKEAA